LRSKALVIDTFQFDPYSSDYCTGEFVVMPKVAKNLAIVVSALHARILSLVIEKRGTPRAILLTIRDYVRLAVPEPRVLKSIGKESRRKRTDTLSSRQIDKVIKAARGNKLKR
jgi:hypothetical protein